MSKRNISRDPYWLTTRFGGRCAEPGCTCAIKRGDWVFYYPSGKTVFCETHGKQRAAEFAAAAADEAFMSGNYL